MFEQIRMWVFKWKMRRLFKKLIKAEQHLARIELARKYFLPEPLAALPPPKKARKTREKGDIPVRITYD